MLRTARPHQWVKNVFVLAPVVFAKSVFDPAVWVGATLAFVSFCLLAAAVYTINDLADVEDDRRHPVKRYRPIAAGRVSESAAKALLVGLVVTGLGLACLGPLSFVLTVAGYFVMNLAYSFKLKDIAYLDVSIISAGFVLRVLAGGFATGIVVSNYLFVCTALLALFLGFGKRRHELAVASASGKTRASLKKYSERGLDVSLRVTAFLTIAVYLAYTLDSNTIAFFQSDRLWLTTAFVGLGVWRFLYLVQSRPKAESPTQEMVGDGAFVAIMLGWIVVVMWIVYNLAPRT